MNYVMAKVTVKPNGSRTFEILPPDYKETPEKPKRGRRTYTRSAIVKVATVDYYGTTYYFPPLLIEGLDY